MSCYNCQTVLDCTGVCQGICQGCQDLCEGYAQCSSACERSGQQYHCRDACESGCQTSCENGCQSSCERSCQSGTQTNRSPGTPSSITVPAEVNGGEKVVIKWGWAYDADNNINVYILERSDDNGSYKQIYSGDILKYEDTIPKGLKTVRYRVYARDTYYATGGYRISDTIKVNNNAAPNISGNSYDYGAVYKDFDIAFIVTDPDAGDEVTVKIYSNGEMVKDLGKITLGVRHTYPVKLSGYTLGKHVIEVRATDKEGASKTNTYRFTKINTPPKFNVASGDLGDKNTAFSFTYQVSDAEGDEVNIVEYLDDEVIRVRKSVAKNTDLSITIDAEKLKTLDINKSHVIRVEAEDTSNGTATLTQTFRRANFAPIISGEDKNLGTIEDKVSHTFSITDVEGDAIKAWVYLDSEQQKTYETIEDGKNYTFVIEGEDFLKLTPGTHALRIVAEDAQGMRSQRVISFTRKVTRLLAEFREPIVTDAAARKIFIVPNWKLANGAKGAIYACNNAFDESPTWEDITSMSTAGLDYQFKNAKRTADKWGVSIKIVVERGAAVLDSYVYGVGGAFE